MRSLFYFKNFFTFTADSKHSIKLSKNGKFFYGIGMRFKIAKLNKGSYE